MLLIQHGILHTMESDDPIQADLLIEDGKITRICREILLKKDTQIVNAEGLHVYPALSMPIVILESLKSRQQPRQMHPMRAPTR